MSRTRRKRLLVAAGEVPHERDAQAPRRAEHATVALVELRRVEPSAERVVDVWVGAGLVPAHSRAGEVSTATAAEGRVVRDANGNVLQDGDSVILIKELKVKGAPAPLKAGTKVKKIRLVEGDHDIDCKIDGYGAMQLKSEFVRKA